MGRIGYQVEDHDFILGSTIPLQVMKIPSQSLEVVGILIPIVPILDISESTLSTVAIAASQAKVINQSCRTATPDWHLVIECLLDTGFFE